MGASAIPVVSDVAKLTDLEALKHAIEQRGDTLTQLFANAGIAEYNSFGNTTEREFDKTFDINVKGYFYRTNTPTLNASIQRYRTHGFYCG